MPDRTDSDSRRLLGRLREAMAEAGAGQARLDRIVRLIASSMGCEVCSVYLFRDADTLELCATVGLLPSAVHKTRMRLGEGLVGRTARDRAVINTADAPSERGFRYMPETGEERYSSFCGVPIQRLGEALGVLVVQSREARIYSPDEVYALEVVAMVLAEMTELGAFVGGDGPALSPRHQRPVTFRGLSGQEGAAAGRVFLHEPRVVVLNPFSDDPEREMARCPRPSSPCARRWTPCSPPRRASTPTRWPSSTPTACSPTPAPGSGAWRTTSAQGCRPRRPSRRSRASPARGCSRPRIPTCASGSTTSTTCRTASCAC
jgi:putative methionine-R-sulfoxide reductase with GAF domain